MKEVQETRPGDAPVSKPAWRRCDCTLAVGLVAPLLMFAFFILGQGNSDSSSSENADTHTLITIFLLFCFYLFGGIAIGEALVALRKPIAKNLKRAYFASLLVNACFLAGFTTLSIYMLLG